MRQQIGQHVVAVLIPRARRRTRIAANHHLEFRIRRVRCEIFIGINIEIGGMIEPAHAPPIPVNSLLPPVPVKGAEVSRSLSARPSVRLYLIYPPPDSAP